MVYQVPRSVSRPLSDRGEQLVPVTTWVRADQLGDRNSGRPDYGWSDNSRRLRVRVAGLWYRNPWVIGSLVLAVAVAVTLVICVGIALLALVAWVTAHALQVGTAIAATVGAVVLVLGALARSRMALAHARDAAYLSGGRYR